MKRKLLLLSGLLIVINLWAYDFQYNSVGYNITSAQSPLTVGVTLDYCSGSINIPDSVSYNGNTYFVTSICDNAFKKSEVNTITIPSSITTISEYAFLNSSFLTSIAVDSHSQYFVTINGVLYNKTLSKIICCVRNINGNITLPNTINSIGSYAFYNCGSLTSIDIPNSVSLVGDSVFCNCKGLTSIVLPNSITSIGKCVFEGCNKLTSAILPDSIKSIGEYSFFNCTSLSSINLPNTIQIIGYYAFGSCSSLSSITLPNSLTTISEKSFRFCSGLVSITIPNSVTSIGQEAFLYCGGLYSLVIPNSVKSISYGAFNGCTRLSSIYSNSITPVDLSNSFVVFSGVSKNTCILYVPIGSKSAYLDAVEWKDFGSIIEQSTEVQNISASEFDLNLKDGKLTLNNLSIGETVQVFTNDGKLVFSKKNTELSLEIQLPKNNIYIVSLGLKRVKIVL